MIKEVGNHLGSKGMVKDNQGWSAMVKNSQGWS